jgi:predicted ATPase/DNA-binding SARP family transcriptional activator
VRIRLFGPLEVVDDADAAVEIVGTRLRTLLARLAVDAGTPIHRDAILDAVWPQSAPGGAVNALQSLVTRLRRQLPGLVESHPVGYRLAVDPSAVDILRFEALAHTDPSAALALWRGEPFAGLHAPFVEAWTARLSELRLRVVQAVVADDLAHGKGSRRLGELAALAGEHPLHEPVNALLMRALVADGRSAQALVVFAELRGRLADELGADPGEELQALHTAILRDSTVDRPEPRLPPALTSFVGRDEELAQVRAALAAGRLVTLTGPGGAGKTRLALELARAWPLPVFLVELAPVHESSGVAATALAAVGAAETSLLGGAVTATQRVVTALRGRASLVVLDNCEHQLDACAALVDAVLAGCPEARILVTTREPLNLTGERLLPVGPLPVPQSTVDLTSAALRLFVDRAQAVRASFELTEETLPAVVEICRRLDGLPLAIELACARLRTLAVDEIAQRLGDRFRLLTGGSRTALPRHQTLAAVVGWSWDLFDESERRLAGRLAVFAGGADLAAIEAVCAGDGLDAADVLTVLIGLVEKSFVRMTPEPPRYSMLDTIQAYATDHLVAAGESDAVRHRHARYLLELAETAEPALRGHEQLTWLAWLSREYDNLTGALRWAVDSGHTEIAVRMVAAVGWYWVLRGASGEATAWLREVLSLPGLDAVEPSTVATTFAYDAVHQFSAGDPERATNSAKTAMAMADGTDHPTVAIVSAVIRANSADVAGALAELATLVDHPDQWAAAAAQLVRGHLAESVGDADGAAQHFAEARRRFEAVGDRWGTTMALSPLADVHSVAGEHAAAIELLTEAIRLAGEVGADDDRDWMRAQRGSERLRAGDATGAMVDLTQAQAAGHERGRPTLIAVAQIYQARAVGDPAVARALASDALQRLDSADGALLPRLRVLATVGLAQAAADAADHMAARGHAADAITGALSIVDAVMLAGVAEGVAEVVYAGGDHAGAARLLGIAVALRGRPDLGSPAVRRLLAELAPVPPEGDASVELAAFADALRRSEQ